MCNDRQCNARLEEILDSVEILGTRIYGKYTIVSLLVLLKCESER